MKKRRIICLCLLILLLAAVPMGCSAKKEVLYVLNWGNYIDPKLIDMFEKEFNCKVVYETYDYNEELYLKLKNANSVYDVVYPSDFMLEKMIREEMLSPLNHDSIPNMKNIRTDLLNREFDPGNKYSVPYFWGTVGILYNTKKVSDPVDSWGILWNEKYTGEILMYDSMRDTIGVALMYRGYSLNTTDENEIKDAEELLIRQKPLVLSYGTDILTDMMVGEEAALAVVFSGDAVNAAEQNPDLAYALPKEGAYMWFDNAAIPKTSQNQALAEKYIDFMMRDDIAKQNTLMYKYSTPNSQVITDLQAQYAWAGSMAYAPSREILAKFEIIKDVGPYIDLYADAWERIKAN